MNLSFSFEDLKILEFLHSRPDEMFYATELARQLEIPKSTLLYRIEKLVNNKYVTEISKGRMKFYKRSNTEGLQFIGKLAKLVTYQYNILERLAELGKSPKETSSEELRDIATKTKTVSESLSKLEKLLNEVENLEVIDKKEERAELVNELFRKMNQILKV